MTRTDLSRARWRKSSRSGQGGESCVELACEPGVTAIRDSKNPSGPVLMFDRSEAVRFLTGLR